MVGSMEQVGVLQKQVNKNGDGRGMHPNSLLNLKNGKATQWPKGQSGNPNGYTITARQKQKMSEDCPFDALGRTWLESLAEGGMRQALTIPVALSNLQDRTEGKVTQQLDTPAVAIINSFTFILPDGTKVSPKELREVEPV